jgi:hypothetical protein
LSGSYPKRPRWPGPLPGVIPGETGSIRPQEETSQADPGLGSGQPGAPSLLSLPPGFLPRRQGSGTRFLMRLASAGRSTGWSPYFILPYISFSRQEENTEMDAINFSGQGRYPRLPPGCEKSPFYPPLIKGGWGGFQRLVFKSNLLNKISRFFTLAVRKYKGSQPKKKILGAFSILTFSLSSLRSLGSLWRSRDLTAIPTV